MKKQFLTMVSFSLLSMPFAAKAADNPLSASVKMQYGMAKANLTKAADKMPDADYSYKPTDSVRSYGQIVGHVANANYMFCSAALGEKEPAEQQHREDQNHESRPRPGLEGFLRLLR